ncbi:6-pyruvoyl trahydropterin synthase family protein [Altererythrobacter sp. Root672]|uniref:6-pyruvoyl trahydropterin synthase family protein n=1 Tax=Altererythrobacter sp. Root672 TaxID=1736584 RepID=UPI0006F3D6FB|nr:6-carboxytetrahydropterin synthase [Altererythrobacter sp. Root672]KRA84087.1 6-pyruvoyl tetrahydrobiopterin synthase [Altererythrobacter sp. Root672]
MWELSKTFWFESAHTLHRQVETEGSLRIHGHSYRAVVTVRGRPEPATGMLIDLSVFQAALSEACTGLDHRLLDEVVDLGPPTLENLCAWIWRTVQPALPDLHRVEVYRDSQGDRCSYEGNAE